MRELENKLKSVKRQPPRAGKFFTACAVAGSLLEAVPAATASAVPGDVVLLSPAGPSFDEFRNYQRRGGAFRQAVNELALFAGRGCAQSAPTESRREAFLMTTEPLDLLRGFLRKNPGANEPKNNYTSHERTPTSAN